MILLLLAMAVVPGEPGTVGCHAPAEWVSESAVSTPPAPVSQVPAVDRLAGCIGDLTDANPQTSTVLDLRPRAQRELAWVPGALQPPRSDVARSARQVSGRVVLVGDGADDVDLVRLCSELEDDLRQRTRVLVGGWRLLQTAGWSTEGALGSEGDAQRVSAERLRVLLDLGLVRLIDVQASESGKPRSRSSSVQELQLAAQPPAWPRALMDKVRPTVYVLPPGASTTQWQERLGVSLSDNVMFYSGTAETIARLRQVQQDVETSKHAVPLSPCARMG